jgi:hypothetical protein
MKGRVALLAREPVGFRFTIFFRNLSGESPVFRKVFGSG